MECDNFKRPLLTQPKDDIGVLPAKDGKWPVSSVPLQRQQFTKENNSTIWECDMRKEPTKTSECHATRFESRLFFTTSEFISNGAEVLPCFIPFFLRTRVKVEYHIIPCPGQFRRTMEVTYLGDK
jgi:hypothetical protein